MSNNPITDTARLNFLDACNQSLNRQAGSQYGWDLVLHRNVVRLVRLDGHNLLNLQDNARHGTESCRGAIDSKLELLQLGLPRNGKSLPDPRDEVVTAAWEFVTVWEGTDNDLTNGPAFANLKEALQRAELRTEEI